MNGELETLEQPRAGFLAWIKKERSPIRVGLSTAILVLGIAIGILFIFFFEEMDVLGVISVFIVVSFISVLAALLVGVLARFIFGRKVGLLVNAIVAIIVITICLVIIKWGFLTPSF